MKSHHYITSNFDICYADYQKIMGKNCPVGTVVLTEEKCREAASQLGLPFNSADTHHGKPSNTHPAGCNEGGHVRWRHLGVLGGEVFFNTITDPSLTPNPWRSTTAICTKQGTEDLVLLSFVL